MTATAPEILDESAGPGRVELTLRVPADLYYLQGHFPDEPILPGVVQVHWAIELGRERFALDSDFKGMEVLKFHRVIKPDTTLHLTIELAEQTGKLHFQYTSEDGKHSQGRVLFG